MNRKRKRKLVVAMAALLVSGLGCVATASDCVRADDSQLATSLAPDTVWQPEIEELEWSEIRPSSFDKAWLDSDYLESSGMSKDHVVVRGVAQTSPALWHAIDDHVLPRLSKLLPLDSVWNRQIARRRLHHELLASSQESPIIVDQFSQTFYRQVGDDQIAAFTREAILLDLSSESMKSLIRNVDHAVHRGRRVRSEALTFAVIGIGITCIVCWIGSRFFNRVTQGYYVWPIRFVTGLVLLCAFGVTAGVAVSILRAL